MQTSGQALTRGPVKYGENIETYATLTLNLVLLIYISLSLLLPLTSVTSLSSADYCLLSDA